MTNYTAGQKLRCITASRYSPTHGKPGDIVTFDASREAVAGYLRIVHDGGRLDTVIASRFEAVVEPAPVAETVITPKAKRIAEFKKGGRCDQLLKFLTTGRTITQGEAIVLGFGTRLAATVHDLRGAGHNVVTSMKEDCHGNPYAEYRLVTRKANGDRKAA